MIILTLKKKAQNVSLGLMIRLIQIHPGKKYPAESFQNYIMMRIIRNYQKQRYIK